MAARGISLALIGLAGLAGAAPATPMLACADQAEIPPFTFAERHNGVESGEAAVAAA